MTQQRGPGEQHLIQVIRDLLRSRIDQPGISTNLRKRLQQVLSQCGPFQSDLALRALFVDQSLFPWRDCVPDANNRQERIQMTIDFLYSQYDDRGTNALVLLLQAISKDTPPTNHCRTEIQRLVEKLRNVA